MKNQDHKLASRNIKPTAMRELVLHAIENENLAIIASEIRIKLEKVIKCI